MFLLPETTRLFGLCVPDEPAVPLDPTLRDLDMVVLPLHVMPACAVISPWLVVSPLVVISIDVSVVVIVLAITTSIM